MCEVKQQLGIWTFHTQKRILWIFFYYDERKKVINTGKKFFEQ